MLRPRYISPALWPLALGAYLVVGVLAALAAEPITRLAVRSGLHPSLGIVISVNLLIPICMVALALWFPRLRIVWLGVVLFFSGYCLGRMGARQPQFWGWTPDLALKVLNPIVVVACVVSAFMATGVALAIRGIRRVGIEDAADRCKSCGYLLLGLDDAKCPECGTVASDRPAQRP